MCIFPFLQFPKLCLQFYTLLHYMCQDFAEKVITLPDKMLLAFIKLLEMGLTKYAFKNVEVGLEYLYKQDFCIFITCLL